MNSVQPLMWCAECGQEMVRRGDGAWRACCRNLGYWTNLRPLPCDRWYPVIVKGEFMFCPSSKWPAGLAPTAPMPGNI